LRPGDEVVTFVARQLEPYRGYHVLMRSLPLLQKLRPNARIVIVGEDGVSYGNAPPNGETWKSVFLKEVAGNLDMRRVHFVGRLPHPLLTRLMQVSAAHVYLTYPFVLSWSLLEAMSIGALIIGSNTLPVQEVIEHEINGLLTDFFDPQGLAHTVADALDNSEKLAHLRAAARETIVSNYDLKSICLPGQIEFVMNDTR
jgi:glycosyltransferase involved in cell wall biosynthesis